MKKVDAEAEAKLAAAKREDAGLATSYMIVLSLAAAIIANVWGLKESHLLWRLGGFVIVALGYPLMGALVVQACAALRKWAHDGDVEDWSREERMLYGAVWPVTGLFSGIVYPFLGIMNRVF